MKVHRAIKQQIVLPAEVNGRGHHHIAIICAHLISTWRTATRTVYCRTRTATPNVLHRCIANAHSILVLLNGKRERATAAHTTEILGRCGWGRCIHIGWNFFWIAAFG